MRRTSARSTCFVTSVSKKLNFKKDEFQKGCLVHKLGQTRSSHQRNHLLLTADTFVRTPLPGMTGCTAVVHAGPAMGAKFAQYIAEFEAGGELGSTPAQRFVFVMEGGLKLEGGGQESGPGVCGYAYLPVGV